MVKRMVFICCAGVLGFAVLLLKPVEGNAYTGGAVRFITGVQSVNVKVGYINIETYKAGDTKPIRTLYVAYTLSGEDPDVIGNRTGYCVQVLVPGREWEQACFDGDAPLRGKSYVASITVDTPGRKDLLVYAQVKVRYGYGGPWDGLYTSWSPSYGEIVKF